MMKRLAILAVLAAFGAGLVPGMAGAVETGESVVVIYNTRVPESRKVAEHYASRRAVPENQLIGLSLPTGENMTRSEFQEQLQRPLLRQLENRRLFIFRSEVRKDADGAPGAIVWRLTESKIRYAVLCWGVPLRVLKDTRLVEQGAEQLQPELRRNEAAVDTELALLPLHDFKLMLTGPFLNPLYGTTNGAYFHPTNGVLMVARLDGPTPEIARGLVDKAIESERNGLWGRAYFDVRGLADGDYKRGDDWIGTAAEITRRFGFETEIDMRPETFPASHPMSQIGFYAGWYDQHVSGPFKQPQVEFMPGAFAYHLHSFSAQTLRSTTQSWVGPLLAAGATATMGCVDEPYLVGTPDIAVFFGRFLPLGFSFGEAAYASQQFLSWQTTVVGDPLYRPFGTHPKIIHERLEQAGDPRVEWSHLRVVNLNLTAGFSLPEMVKYLEDLTLTRQSAVLLEKLAELYEKQGKPASSLLTLRQALDQKPTRQQEVRIRLALGHRLDAAEQPAEAQEAYDALLQRFPDFPDRISILEKLVSLSAKQGNGADEARYRAEIGRLQGR